MAGIELTDEQQFVYNGIAKWIENPDQQVISLGGLAGTGKTTLINRIWSDFRAKRIVTCAPTGKAALVLANKGILNAQTIRKTFYGSLVDNINGDDYVVGQELKESVLADFIICDEASMVDDATFNDMISFKIPILLVGDHGQLPPIKQAKSNELVLDPTFRLETPLRQALDNEIIVAAHDVRKKLKIDFNKFSKHVFKIDHVAFEADQIICATNKTKVMANVQSRYIRNFPKSKPVKGDRVIAQEGRKILGQTIRNGQQFIVVSVKIDGEYAVLNLQDIATKRSYNNIPTPLNAYNNTENQKSPDDVWKVNSKSIIMDYSYAITCHKAQGSEWDNVSIILENWPDEREERKRWLYTAITRAKKSLTVFDMR